MSGSARVLAIGVVTAFGDEPAEVYSAVYAGRTALAPQLHLHALPDPRAAVVVGPDLSGWLTRKKDAKMLARAARLALPAAGRALRALPDGVGEDTAIFVAVGREPPDDPDAEPSLLAMERGGVLARDLLAGRGRELYPPLLPLRTLPNMVLAHVSIQHGLRGENGTFAGGREAGVQALAAGFRAVEEGRAPYALAGASFSGTDLASARDRLRLGLTAPPGEAAVFVLIGPACGDTGGPDPDGDTADDVLTPLDASAWAAAVGDCGPVAGFWPMLSPAR